MTRSGMAATWSAVRYSGFFLNKEEFSRVEASSVGLLSVRLSLGRYRRRFTFVSLFELGLGWEI